MKARIPREYEDLSSKQKERLKKYCIDVATKAAMAQADYDNRVILDIYMKMVCCVLHDAFGFGEKRLTYFIANHKRLFYRQTKLVSKGEQLDYLNKRMSKIFKKGGFPQKFMDDILGEINMIDKPKED